MIFGTALAEPVLTKAQVSKLGHAILSVRQHEKYEAVFDCDKPSYDFQRKLWIFPGGFPVTLGGSIDVFELREQDGYYRLGTLSLQTFSPSPPRFRIAPSARRQVRELLKVFALQRAKQPGYYKNGNIIGKFVNGK